MIIQSQTSGGDIFLNSIFLEQDGNNNKMTQKEKAPGSNSGQSETAHQTGNYNVGTQNILMAIPKA